MLITFYGKDARGNGYLRRFVQPRPVAIVCETNPESQKSPVASSLLPLMRRVGRADKVAYRVRIDLARSRVIQWGPITPATLQAVTSRP